MWNKAMFHVSRHLIRTGLFLAFTSLSSTCIIRDRVTAQSIQSAMQPKGNADNFCPAPELLIIPMIAILLIL